MLMQLCVMFMKALVLSIMSHNVTHALMLRRATPFPAVYIRCVVLLLLSIISIILNLLYFLCIVLNYEPLNP